MRIFALGGAGKICRESVLDLVRFGTFDQLTIGDVHLDAAKEAAEWLNHPKVDYTLIDVKDKEASIALLSEYDPKLPGRTVFENGEFIQVPPFARPLEIELPQPYGKSIQYIIPHSETFTLAKYLENKGVELIEVRGTWPKENMELIRALYNYGFLNNQMISLNGFEFGIMEAIGEYLQHSAKGKTTELFGYSLHIEVEGIKEGRLVRQTLTHTHPSSDGTVPGWEGLRANTRNVGIPMSIAAQLILQGKYTGSGALYPEFVFNPAIFFEELAKREIYIHIIEETL